MPLADKGARTQQSIRSSKNRMLVPGNASATKWYHHAIFSCVTKMAICGAARKKLNISPDDRPYLIDYPNIGAKPKCSRTDGKHAKTTELGEY